MDNFEMNQAIKALEPHFWKKALQTRGVKPTPRNIARLKRHFFDWWTAHRALRLESAWAEYTDHVEFYAFIEACKQGKLARSEVYNLLYDGFGTIGVYNNSYRNEIRQIMKPLVAANLVEHRVVRGGGHYWQPEHLKHMDFEEYLQMLTDIAFKAVNGHKAAA